jgi:hypothetical protein
LYSQELDVGLKSIVGLFSHQFVKQLAKFGTNKVILLDSIVALNVPGSENMGALFVHFLKHFLCGHRVDGIFFATNAKKSLGVVCKDVPSLHVGVEILLVVHSCFLLFLWFKPTTKGTTVGDALDL